MTFAIVFDDNKFSDDDTYNRLKVICPNLERPNTGISRVDLKQLNDIIQYCNSNSIKNIITVRQERIIRMKSYLNIISIYQNNSVKLLSTSSTSHITLQFKKINGYFLGITDWLINTHTLTNVVNIDLTISSVLTYDQLTTLKHKFSIKFDKLLGFTNHYIILNNGTKLILDTADATCEYDIKTDTFNNVNLNIDWNTFKILLLYLSTTQNKGVNITIGKWNGDVLYSNILFNSIDYSLGNYILTSGSKEYIICFEEVCVFIIHPLL